MNDDGPEITRAVYKKRMTFLYEQGRSPNTVIFPTEWSDKIIEGHALGAVTRLLELDVIFSPQVTGPKVGLLV